ncbi:MAG TPA: cysteine desulfurase family protein [Thermoanaerobaculia bacterium]|nr:cysteine desulfurase family protein [Thermoanaerobaculia bacterium]
MAGRLIYLDHNATTPVDPRVLAAMLPYFTDDFGNAASRQHRPGRLAAEAVEHARRRVAAALGADPREIVWTSGATEANNLAIQGVAASAVYARRRTIVTVRTEHRAVLDPCAAMARAGYRVLYQPVDRGGRLDLERLVRELDDDTLLVSAMWANNETGVLHPIAEIGRLCKERGILFHTDATQAFGREPIDVERAGIDLLSLSGHKIHGPKGVGALYVRRKGPRVRCEPLLHGGGHERGLRSGTLNVPGIVGLGQASEIAVAHLHDERRRLAALRHRLEHELLAALAGASVNGVRDHRLANTLNLSIPGVEAEALMARMPDLAVSSSAACSSATRLPSYVLRAMGVGDAQIRGSLRFSLGRTTSAEEIERAIAILLDACAGTVETVAPRSSRRAAPTADGRSTPPSAAE